MRSPRSRLWSKPVPIGPSVPDILPLRRMTTPATVRRPCLPPSTSWKARCSAAACSAIATVSSSAFSRRRGRGPCGQGDPRGARQLRKPQAPEGAHLARPPSALDLPLHPDLGLMAQRGRRLLFHAHAPPPATGHLHRCRRSSGCHQTLHRRAQPQRPPLRLDQSRRSNLQRP